jgi:LemA protein
MEWLIGLACLALVAIVLVGYGIFAYNGLVRARNEYKNAFAQIDVQLTRRHDLIPNLVEVAKGYMKHERETLEAVVNEITRANGRAIAAQHAGVQRELLADGGGHAGTAMPGRRDPGTIELAIASIKMPYPNPV